MGNQHQAIQLILQVNSRNNEREEADLETRQLLEEINELGFGNAELEKDAMVPDGAMGVDPVLLGTIALAIMPSVATKCLEFLHAWAIRKEGRIIKIKIQSTKNKLLEVEFPASISPEEATKWINTVSESIIPRT